MLLNHSLPSAGAAAPPPCTVVRTDSSENPASTMDVSCTSLCLQVWKLSYKSLPFHLTARAQPCPTTIPMLHHYHWLLLLLLLPEKKGTNRKVRRKSTTEITAATRMAMRSAKCRKKQRHRRTNNNCNISIKHFRANKFTSNRIVSTDHNANPTARSPPPSLSFSLSLSLSSPFPANELRTRVAGFVESSVCRKKLQCILHSRRFSSVFFSGCNTIHTLWMQCRWLRCVLFLRRNFIAKWRVALKVESSGTDDYRFIARRDFSCELGCGFPHHTAWSWYLVRVSYDQKRFEQLHWYAGGV